MAPDEQLMAVPVRLAADARTVEAGTPVPLFRTRMGAWQATSPEYVVSPDGQSFLIHTLTEETSNPPITVILNWKSKAAGASN